MDNDIKTRVPILAAALLAVGVLLMPFNSYILGQENISNSKNIQKTVGSNSSATLHFAFDYSL
jgi:hypothetical protein